MAELRSFSSPLQTYYQAHSLRTILLSGALLRLLAVLFSKGYAFHDDHFEVVEVAWLWLEGIPRWFDEPGVYVHSLVYPGLHYLFFALLEALGLHDGQGMMYAVRALHAAFSLLSIYYGYRLTYQLSHNRQIANTAGWVLAFLFIFPFLSVRDLREMVCIPPLLAGYCALLRADRPWRRAMEAGVWFGLAFVFRYQSLFFLVGTGPVLLLQRRWATTTGLIMGFFVAAFLTQGLVDWYFWGYPFAGPLSYFLYNADAGNVANYPQGPWYQYLLTTLGVLPFLSFLLIPGLLQLYRKAPLVFWGTVAFFVIHSFYPNKQERFILPFIPFLIVLGSAGWAPLLAKHPTWRPASRWSYRLFWSLNTLGLLLLTFAYSKRSRVEVMDYLGDLPDVRGVLVESNRDQVMILPRFYANQLLPYYTFGARDTAMNLQQAVAVEPPNYVIFLNNEQLAQRIKRLQVLYPHLTFVRSFEPGVLDRIAYWLNPRFNVNETNYLYRLDSPTDLR